MDVTGFLSVPAERPLAGRARAHELTTHGWYSQSPPVWGSAAPGTAGVDEQEDEMSILDKIMGRTKKAAGDLTGDGSLRREGRQEERKGEAKEELAETQDRADAKAEEVANLERKTN